MSDSQQSASYYEIALTNRQVLVAFVILLVCLVAAFFSGVWVGRGGDFSPPPPQVAETPAAAGVEAEPGGGRISFFEDEAAPAEASPAPESAAAEPPAEPATEPPATREMPAAGPRRPAERAPAGAPPSSARPAEPSGVVVQVFSSADREQAELQVERLTRDGYPAYVSSLEVRGRTMYRVRIGPYEDETAADGVAERLKREYRFETWVTEGG